MHPLMVAAFTTGAFLNAYIAFHCLQEKVWKALGNLRPLVKFLFLLNMTTYGTFLFVFTSQEFTSSSWTATCILGPLVAQLCVCLSHLCQTILVIVAFLINSKGWRVSLKQAFLILTLVVLASVLLLSPAFWVAANNTRPLITSIQCLDKVELKTDDVINRKLYFQFVSVFQFGIPGFVLSLVLWSRLKRYITQKATPSPGELKRRLLYKVVDIVVVSLMIMSWVLLLLARCNKEFEVIVLPSEFCLIVIYSPLFLLVIASELVAAAEKDHFTRNAAASTNSGKLSLSTTEEVTILFQ